MKLGDLLEFVGAIALTAAAYLYLGVAGAVGVGGVSLVYLGNCLAGVELPKRASKQKLIGARAQLELALQTPGFLPGDVQRLKEQVAYWETRAKGPLPSKLEIHSMWRERHVHKLGEDNV